MQAWTVPGFPSVIYIYIYAIYMAEVWRTQYLHCLCIDSLTYTYICLCPCPCPRPCLCYVYVDVVIDVDVDVYVYVYAWRDRYVKCKFWLFRIQNSVSIKSSGLRELSAPCLARLCWSAASLQSGEAHEAGFLKGFLKGFYKGIAP